MIAIDPMGLKLVVASSSGYAHLLAIDVYGRLSDINGSVNIYSWRSIAFGPTGEFLYASYTDSPNDYFAIYGFDSTGNLVPPSSTLSYTKLRSVAVHPSGKYLFYGYENGGVRSISINRITNAGTLISLGKIETITNSHVNKMAIHPDGNYLYAGYESGLNALSYYRIASGGGLIFQGITPFFDSEDYVVPTAIGICAKTVFGEN